MLWMITYRMTDMPYETIKGWVNGKNENVIFFIKLFS